MDRLRFTICLAGGAIVIITPNHEELNAFMDELSHDGIAVPKEDNDDHFCSIYAFNNHLDTYLLVDLCEDDPMLITHIEISTVKGSNTGEEVTTKDSVIRQTSMDAISQTPYSYGSQADDLVSWLEKYVQEATTSEISSAKIMKSAGLVKSGSDDLKQLAHAQTITFTYQCTVEGVKDRIANYSNTYYVYSLYSFDQDVDYYLIHQEASGYNGNMIAGHWTDKDWLYYGYYFSMFQQRHQLRKSDGTDFRSNEVNLLNHQPATTQNASTHVTGQSFSLGGNVGLTGKGPSVNISGGVTFSDSWSTVIADVSIANACMGGASGNDAVWEYGIAN
jgi:hypothetical protein